MLVSARACMCMFVYVRGCLRVSVFMCVRVCVRARTHVCVRACVLIVRDKVTRLCPHNTTFKEKKEPKLNLTHVCVCARAY